MPVLNLSFSSVPSNDVPDGDFDAVIASVEMVTASTGTPQLVWTFIISGGEQAGRKVVMRTGLTDKSMWNTRDAFQALGFDGSQDLSISVDDETGTLLTPDLTDLPVQITILNEEYQGRKIPKANSINKAYRVPEGAAEVEASGPGKKEKKAKLL